MNLGSTTIRGLSRGLASLVALVVLAVAAPVGLAWASRSRFGSANPLAGLRPPWRWGSDDVARSLGRPLEDDTLIDVAIRSSIVAVWVAIIIVLVSVAVEAAHLVRHSELPRQGRPGVAWAQPLARMIAVGLVAVVPMIGRAADAGAPAAVDLLGPPRGPNATSVTPKPVDAEPERRIPRVDDVERGDVPDAVVPASPVSVEVTRAEGQRVHLVQRGESVWSIAEQLGDGSESGTLAMADELLDRNLGLRMTDGSVFSNPALIRPGWMLVTPSDAETSDPLSPPTELGSHDAVEHGPVGPEAIDVHVVADGDTLSRIAEERLGDDARWPDIADANLGRTMPDGRVFDDPDLIVPGWTLDVAGALDEIEPTPVVDEADDDGANTEAPAPADSAEEDRAPSSPVVPEHDWFDERDDTFPAPTTAPVEVEPPVVSVVEESSQVPGASLGDAMLSGEARTPENPTTSTTAVPVAGLDAADESGDRGPSTLGIGHAAMLAGGVLALAAVVRQRRLRGARPHARVPVPPDHVVDTIRALGSVGPAERPARLDVAMRSLGRRLLDSGARVGAVLHAADGTIEVALTGSAVPGAPWEGSGTRWELPASVPIELLATDAASAGSPCPTLVAIGRFEHGEMLVDPEAVGVVSIGGPVEAAEAITVAIASTLATSLAAETAHLVTVGLDERVGFDQPNVVEVGNAVDAVRLACDAVGSLVTHPSGSADLRVRRTGGEAWEPAVIVIGSAVSTAVEALGLPEPGRGVGAVVAGGPPGVGASLDVVDGSWKLSVCGWEVEVEPFGLDTEDLERLVAVVDHARTLVEDEPSSPGIDDQEVWAEGGSHLDADLAEPAVLPRFGDSVQSADDDGPADEAAVPVDVVPAHAIVVSTLGGVEVATSEGETRAWQRSKTLELIAWLVTHRHRSTRAAARTAMWSGSVRDATFSNVVSEARRGLARLVPPAAGEEWIPRTMTEDLLLHRLVVSDLDLLRSRLDAARVAAPAQALAILRPGLAHITGLPFADTAYLWPDADGLVTDATLLATTYCTELAEHGLSLGDIEVVFEATSHGLAVLPGHDELVALRMRAHARGGDLASVRAEWESYERVVAADSWSDGEPSPRLLDLRRELLS